MRVFILGLVSFFLLSCQEQIENDLPKYKHPLIQQLANGNQRFLQDAVTAHPHLLAELQSNANHQSPKIVVVTCSDSRLPPELLFDQGFGQLFVIRTAGNIVGPIELGSVEYAVEHLGASLIVVLGHERCGAITAYVEGKHEHNHIQTLLDSLAEEPELSQAMQHKENRIEACVVANVQHAVHFMPQESTLINDKIKQGKLALVGARCDLDSGIVQFYE